ncbi:winged helix-turn-helix transcriptional regulator, partial [Streptomyces sp. TRM76130]|nr:winged helix-turn-helix transcriptional regulator [Streptomyces sp. TRM76130]
AAAYVYELTGRGRALLPVLQALGGWGAAEMDERRPTDALRAHWFALPLLSALDGTGVVEVRLLEGDFHDGVFHLYAGATDGQAYGEGPAPREPDARLVLDAGTCAAVGRGVTSVTDAVRAGRIEVTGDGELAKALREAAA